MKYLSLFSGVGMGDLGLQQFLGWRCLGYVEIEKYCQKIIKARQDDGMLDIAPIFGDIRDFIDQGYAGRYREMVDCVSGGPPCQPFSTAGKRKGKNDERNMWPEMLRCIRMVRPRFAFLENVPGLLSSGYFGQILGDMAESGYDCRWRVLSAAEMGAPHRRDRLWVIAYTDEQYGNNSRHGAGAIFGERSTEAEIQICNSAESGFSNREQKTVDGSEKRISVLQSKRSDWWGTKPELGRVAHRMPNRVDRLRAIGNGQVPIVAAAAWNLLMENHE